MLLLVMLATMAFPPQDVRAQDAAAGERAFKKCLPCHSVGIGARHKFGPHLNGLDGRRSGGVADYRFSYAYRSAGLVWEEAAFVEYIKDPKSMFPGAKMGFRGIRDEDEALNLWAYISQFNADGTRE